MKSPTLHTIVINLFRVRKFLAKEAQALSHFFSGGDGILMFIYPPLVFQQIMLPFTALELRKYKKFTQNDYQAVDR